eukprot:364820-Pyramimonas_sp.AAC.2
MPTSSFALWPARAHCRWYWCFILTSSAAAPGPAAPRSHRASISVPTLRCPPSRHISSAAPRASSPAASKAHAAARVCPPRA